MWISVVVLIGVSSLSAADDFSVQDLAYLFDRPGEPIFYPKGDGAVAFDVPVDYLPVRYHTFSESYFKQFREVSTVQRTILVERAKEVPDLSDISDLPQRDPFSILLPGHRKRAKKLTKIFLAQPTARDLLSVAVYARGQVNIYLFVYSLSVALTHREDTATVLVPPVFTFLPEMFIAGKVFEQAREEVTGVTEPGSRVPLVIPLNFTATNLQLEHQVAFYREDIGLNLFHWYWHILYPFEGPLEIVNKDRRGELFYYFHEQLIARYNFERLGVRLPRVRRFLDFRQPILEGYFSKLNMKTASRVWPGRQDNSYLRNIDRPDLEFQFDIQEMERSRDLIFNAIHSGYFIDESGARRSMNNTEGIDLLANVVESSILSINRPFYGDMHNQGHLVIGLIHDPDGRHREPIGVMGNFATSVRDPAFFIWHAFVTYIFSEHKNRLSPYTVNELGFPSIKVGSVQVQTEDLNHRNEFNTFWEKADLELSRGLDFLPPGGPLYVRVTRLQHRDFTYTIQVQNNGPTNREGFVRIFLGPKHNEIGQTMNFDELKNLMIEMDRFNHTLRPGSNTISRRNADSSLTTPQLGIGAGLPPGAGGLPNDTYYCGCGWPQNLLLPKGRAEGMPAVLFVAITDYSKDRVELLPGQPTGPLACSSAPVLCGVRGGLYPDRRPMGFPFDRQARAGVKSLDSFLTANMAVQEVSIRFLHHPGDDYEL